MSSGTKTVAFAKMNGSGNDFVLVDDMQGHLAGVDLSALAKRVCRRKFSIGADGLIVLVQSDTADFGWRFFNADGSAAEMCGNGARCATRFATMRGIAKSPLKFETVAGVIEGETTEAGARVTLTTPHGYEEGIEIGLPSGPATALFVDTGVPHAVFAVDDIGTRDVDVEGRFVRHHERFRPAGANANFIAKIGENRIKVRTYERGVEAETYACGTGAVASALAAHRLGWVTSPVEAITSGGNRLVVYFEGEWGGYSGVRLEGDARLVYEGTWSADALRDD